MLSLVIGQRPAQTPNQRSWRVLDNLRQASGGIAVNRNLPLDIVGDLYIQWGYRLTAALDSVIELRKPFAILDGGFFADRDHWVSISFNGFQELGTYIPPPTHRPRHPLPRCEPWVGPKDRDVIMCFGQVPSDRSLRGLDHDAYWKAKMDEIRKLYPDKRVIFRPHPKSEKPHLDLPPLEKLFEPMYMAVTYTSTVAVQTILAGIPTVVGHEASVASPVCSFHPKDWIYPGRADWLHGLSWRQYEDTDIKGILERLEYGLPYAERGATYMEYDLQGIRP